MPEPTKPQADERHTVEAEDDPTIRIPNDQVHPALRDSPHPDQTRTYPVVVNGKEENWTIEKLTTEAQTGAAGREKFQEAAEMRKETAKAVAIQEDLAQVFKEGDIDAFRRLGAAYGVPGDQVEAIAQKTFGSQDDDEAIVNDSFENSSQADQQATRSRKERPVDYSQLSPDVQRVVRLGEKARVSEIVTAALDSDEFIAYNMKAQTPEGAKAIRLYVDEKINGRLNQVGGDFGDNGARILAEVIPEVRDHLRALGTPGQRTRMGLGQAPGGGDTEVHPAKRPAHVPSTEGDAFDQNVLEDMEWAHNRVRQGETL